MAKTMEVQKVAAIETVAEKQNEWQLAVNNPELPMADRIEAFKALAAERKFAQDERRFQARSSILSSDADRAEAETVAPMVYAALVEQERLRLRTGNFDQSPLVLFALGYKSEIKADGTVSYGPFGYIIRSVVRPRMRAIGDLAPIDYGRVQGSGGTFAERLFLLKREYERIYGNLSFGASPTLVKAGSQD